MKLLAALLFLTFPTPVKAEFVRGWVLLSITHSCNMETDVLRPGFCAGSLTLLTPDSKYPLQIVVPFSVPIERDGNKPSTLCGDSDFVKASYYRNDMGLNVATEVWCQTDRYSPVTPYRGDPYSKRRK